MTKEEWEKIKVVDYIELSDYRDDYPAIRDHLEKTRYLGQEKIVKYLRNGKIALATPGLNKKDVFSGRRINYCGHALSVAYMCGATSFPIM